MTLYRNSQTIQKTIRKIFVLPSLPPNSVGQLFQTLRSDFDTRRQIISNQLKHPTETSRNRPNSTAYLRLKKAKGFQNDKVLVNRGPFYEQKLKKSHYVKKTEMGDPSGFLKNHSVAKLQKNEVGNF